MSNKANYEVKWLLEHPRDGVPITHAEKGLLMQLADDHNEDRGYAWPSIPKIAERARLSEKHARRLLHRMVALGTIESRATVNKFTGARASNEYRFWFDRPFDRRKGRYAEQTIKMQEMRAASRPKQMSLQEAQLTGHAAHAELAADEPNESLFFAQARSGATPLEGRGSPDTGGSAPLTPEGVTPSLPGEGFNTSTAPVQHQISAQDIPHAVAEGEDSTSVGDRDAMPFANLRVRDAKFRQELGKAATWLRDRLRISDVTMERNLAAAMAQFCNLEHQGVQSAASLARQNWQEYQRLGEVGHLRVKYGAPKFFGHGYWCQPNRWELTESGRQAIRAMTGAYRTGGQA